MVIERDDGFIAVDGTDYFGGLGEQDEWAIARAPGRVLDVGSGAGRGALAVQARGQEVTALDTSPGAVETCRRRGVRSVYEGTLAQAAADGLAGAFDSALLLGSDLGLIGSPENAGSFLGDLGMLLQPGGVIVGTILDVYQTSNPAHLAYHERNRARSRMAGHLTMRVRYENVAGAWFDWLAASPPNWPNSPLTRAGKSWTVSLVSRTRWPCATFDGSRSTQRPHTLLNWNRSPKPW